MIIITVNSKNKTILQKFLIFLQKRLPILNLQMILKYNKKEKKRKIITVLKSPHINKTSQEKFELTNYSLKISTNSFRTHKYLLYFKKLNNNLFPDVKIKTVICIQHKKKEQFKPFFLNLDMFVLNLDQMSKIQNCNSKRIKKFDIKDCNKGLLEKTVNYLKILDCLGELDLQ